MGETIGLVSGSTTWLFLENAMYIETIGFLAVFFEALLGTPQFLRNFRLKSTEGMSVKMVSRFSPPPPRHRLDSHPFLIAGTHVDVR